MPKDNTKEEEIKLKDLTNNEKQVLEVLFENTDTWDERCIGFDWITGDSKLSRKEVQKSCKTLREYGLVEFHRGLMDDDGKVAGSGYNISQKGSALINPCDICGDSADYDWYEDTLGNQVMKHQSVKRIRLCEEHYKKI